tara:strand:- start:1194 stop:1922 length:729 start_codon:yes stop_codon:yes gene_type:complete
MADVTGCANIELEIEGITGVIDADDNFIISAQKFVVANVPKNLMKWASSQSAVMTSNADNDAVLNVDTILSVKRNGYPCKEISLDNLVWADDDGSLKKATITHPIYVVSGGKIQIQPEPESGKEGYYYYVDHTKVDDGSDLRNVVINYACFKEFAKLMMVSTLQGDFSASATTFGTEHWIGTDEDSEMLMARIQTIQAQLGEKTHFGQMSQQHYNLALAEVKSYIENNTKTLETAMAMRGSK